MQKLVIDCSKPIGQQETLVDMTEEEIAAIQAQEQEPTNEGE